MAIVELISSQPLAVEEIVEQLRPRAGKRTVHEDIAWLHETFPHHCLREKAGKAHGPYRVVYRWQGQPPVLLERPITWLTEEELIALVAARGFLRRPNPDRPFCDAEPDEDDLLGRAIGDLLTRAGVQEDAGALDRTVVSVSRFGAAPMDPTCLATALTATAVGDAITFDYENLQGRRRRIHAAPQRCVLIKGEWYVIAWAGSLKHFRLSRMEQVERTTQQPEGAPGHITAAEVDALLASGFYATSSTRPKDRVRVHLGVSPDAWPHIRDRRWGDNQTIEEKSKGLPEGWRRVCFTTTGLTECRHWVLAMGANVRAERPKALVEWVSEQASELTDALSEGAYL